MGQVEWLEFLGKVMSGQVGIEAHPPKFIYFGWKHLNYLTEQILIQSLEDISLYNFDAITLPHPLISNLQFRNFDFDFKFICLFVRTEKQFRMLHQAEQQTAICQKNKIFNICRVNQTFPFIQNDIFSQSELFFQHFYAIT